MGYDGKIRVGGAVESPYKVLRFRCISKKYGNFINNKIYTAEAHASKINRTIFTDYKVTDEDGDYYTVYNTDLGKLFLKLIN